MKKTVYSLITILALNIHLNAENIEIIDTPIIETEIINIIETTDDTLPAEETIPLDDTIIQEETIEVTNTIKEDSNVTNMKMTDTDGKSYSVVASGNNIKIEGMEEKVVFLEFFGLKCPACKDLMPHLISLQEKHKEKLQVMSIEVQKNDVDPINAYKKEHNINYITFSNYDVGAMVRYVAEKSSWTGHIPFTVAINSKGEVQFAQSGVISEEDLEKYIELYSK